MLQYLRKLRYHFRDIIDYWRAFRRREHSDLKVITVTSKEQLLAAKKLHAQVYLSRKFVKKSDIVRGVLTEAADPYHRHSQYFIVVDKATGHLVATARQIQAHPQKGHNSFAMFNHTPLYKRVYKTIGRHEPIDCIEISGLAKLRGASKLAPLLLYRAMWQHSLQNKHKLWLLASDLKLYVRLKLLFGPAIQKAGPVTFYMGSYVAPAIFRMDRSISAMGRAIDNATFYQKWLRRRVARFMLNGVPVELLSEKEQRALASLREKHNLFSK